MRLGRSNSIPTTFLKLIGFDNSLLGHIETISLGLEGCVKSRRDACPKCFVFITRSKELFTGKQLGRNGKQNIPQSSNGVQIWRAPLACFQRQSLRASCAHDGLDFETAHISCQRNMEAFLLRFSPKAASTTWPSVGPVCIKAMNL